MRDPEPAQAALFDSTRYSPVSVAIWQRLPESNARAFGIGSALGSYLGDSGSSAPLRSGRDAACSFISATRLPAVLAALNDLDPSQWRRYVREWASLYVAHRCSRGTVALFTKPQLLECPACHERIEIHDVPEMWKRTKAARKAANGSVTPAETGALLPQRGANTHVSHQEAARILPQSERRATHQPRRSLQGLEVGVPLTTEEEEAFLLAETLLKSRSEIAPRSSEIEELDG